MLEILNKNKKIRELNNEIEKLNQKGRYKRKIY